MDRFRTTCKGIYRFRTACNRIYRFPTTCNGIYRFCTTCKGIYKCRTTCKGIPNIYILHNMQGKMQTAHNMQWNISIFHSKGQDAREYWHRFRTKCKGNPYNIFDSAIPVYMTPRSLTQQNQVNSCLLYIIVCGTKHDFLAR